MHKVALEQWSWEQVAEPLLPYCLAMSEQEQQDVAALVTADGLLVASPQAWREASLQLCNLQILMQRQGQRCKAQFESPAHEIRKLLHDAVASREQQQPSYDSAIQRSRAHQALEDLVSQALVLRASDIHLVFEPQQASVTFRVYGLLVQRSERSRELMSAAIAAALNTRSDDFHELFDEHNLSSASIRMTLLHHGQPTPLRLRVQKSPTRLGFAVTMRIQFEQAPIASLAELGFAEQDLKALRKSVQAGGGMIVIAGATGQGKTTTLAGLNRLLPMDCKVISLEDPIEIVQPHIEQKPILAEHAELNFANMVKVALREDPDVISISEIRDEKTAHAAYTAALTGHLVTATVHAHDCFGILQRLLDLGLSAASLAQPGVLQCMIAQRLVTTVCPNCTGGNPVCDRCHGVGAIGRTLVYELLTVDDALRLAIRTQQLTEYWQQLQQSKWRSIENKLQQVSTEVDSCV